MNLTPWRRRRTRPLMGSDTDPRWPTAARPRLAGHDDGRYLRIPTIDAWRSAGFDVPPPPNRGDYRLRVRQLIEGLGPDALDEGSGAVLDAYIGSWVASWIASVNTAFVDHASVIDVHYGQAAEWLAEAEAALEFDVQRLAEAQRGYDTARARLAGDDQCDRHAAPPKAPTAIDEETS